MTTVTAARPGSGISAGELRQALEQTLREVDADESVAPLMGATHLRMRFEFTDLDLALNVASTEGDTGIRWSFEDDPGWTPKLTLRMTGEIANRYLQGRENIAIALARGQVRCRGESRAALLYLPAARRLAKAYRRVVEADHPGLVAT